MTLLLGLLLMAALSLLALAASSDHVLQARMVQNLQRSELSYATANSALAWAEDWLLGLSGDSRPTPCAGPCPAGSVIRAPDGYPPAPEHASPQWWAANGFKDGHDPLSGIALANRAVHAGEPGLWIVEEVWFSEAAPLDDGRPAIAYYRILARGANADGYAAVTESVIARPWGSAEWADAFPASMGGTRFCAGQPPAVPCGRLAWRRRH